VSDLSNPRRAGHKTLNQYMGQEMQSRYLNPRWADKMLAEGYSGARFINRVVDYLWAWQVTVPEAVDNGTWQRMYDTYVADRHGLRVRERIAQAGNLRAWQAVTDRMLSAIEKGYWKPDDATRRRLLAENARAVAEGGAACGADTCSRATLTLQPLLAGRAPGEGGAVPRVPAAPAVAPAGVTKAAKAAEPAPAPEGEVSGFEMESVKAMTPVQKTVGTLVVLALAIAVVGGGYAWRRRAVTYGTDSGR
jgi:cobaltochelatase CobN